MGYRTGIMAALADCDLNDTGTTAIIFSLAKKPAFPKCGTAISCWRILLLKRLAAIHMPTAVTTVSNNMILNSATIKKLNAPKTTVKPINLGKIYLNLFFIFSFVLQLILKAFAVVDEQSLHFTLSIFKILP